MRAIVLADLDDSLFQTRRKCPADVAEDRLVPLAFGEDGAPMGFATPRQHGFLDWLSDGACLVPVTARSRAALERVSLSYRYAICAHGGVVLEDGRPWPAWQARMADAAAACADALARLERSLARLGGPELRVWTVAEPAPLFLVAKHRGRDEAALAAAVAALGPELPAGWRIATNGNNAAVLPPHLCKAEAAAALLPKLRDAWPDAPVIGLGDSDSDAPFLRLCDFAMMPARSQLARRLERAP